VNKRAFHKREEANREARGSLLLGYRKRWEQSSTGRIRRFWVRSILAVGARRLLSVAFVCLRVRVRVEWGRDWRLPKRTVFLLEQWALFYGTGGR
jgi:hypothetical protein